MRHRMSLRARRELLVSTAPRYATASKSEKQKILDEFTASTGYHRKYAIRLLRQPGERAPRSPPQVEPSRPKRRARRYTPEVQAALVSVWEAANRICSKRLVPFLPELVTALECHGHLCVSETTRQRLLSISPATVDRLLYEVRQRSRRGHSTTKPGSLLKGQIPVRTFADWDENRPGFSEADLVAHCGTRTSGSYLNSLVVTDIATSWTECMALLYRDQEAVLRGVGEARERMPFPLLGLDTDNGSEFLNYALLEYCREEAITFTRSRPYRKNDQCYVEEKNGSIVRRWVGYDRYEGVQPCQILTALHEVLRLYVNFFQPSMKLISKQRQGSKVIKKYGVAQTPYQRVLASAHVAETSKQELREQYAQLDPVALQRELHRLQERLWRYAHVEVSPRKYRASAAQDLAVTLPASEESSRGGSGEGEIRNEPRMYRRTNKPRKPQVKRWWRTRVDPFADVCGEIEQWLEQCPHLSASDLLSALQKKHPGWFPDNQLRTLQRRVKAWRVAQASRIENASETLDLYQLRADSSTYSPAIPVSVEQPVAVVVP